MTIKTSNPTRPMSGHCPLSLKRILSIAAVAASVGCVCPPCEAPGAAAAKPIPVLPVGSRLVIWDGEGGGLEGGKSWADCDKKAGPCKSTLASTAKVGKGGSKGLKFHAEGEGWQGGGWNWFGWWPENAGTDIRPYTHLTLWVQVLSKTSETGPEPGSLGFSFGCSAGKKGTATAILSKYEKNLLDGQWHQVTIPLTDLYVGKDGSEFDPGTAWEFRLNHWAGSPRNFDLIMDDIAVEKQQ
jgi:hypothetical protein